MQEPNCENDELVAAEAVNARHHGSLCRVAP